MTKRTTVALSVGALLLLLAAVGPAEAAFPGANGKISYGFGGIARPGAEQDYEIWSINPDGSAKTNLTENDGIDDLDPAWSPDGGRVAYISHARNSEPDLFVMNADGSGQTRLTETPEMEELQPTWSPDGTRIAFTRVEKFNSGTPDYYDNYDVYVINADGTGEVRLTDSPSRELQPAWSPDGSRLAFTSSRSAREDEIYVMKPAPEGPSNEPARLTKTRGDNYAPNWSPDGEKIAFMSERDRLQDHFGVPEIYKMSADGTSQTRLTFRGNYEDPAWSPNGRKLAFNREGLYTMKASPLSKKNRPQAVTGSSIGYDHYDPDWQAIP